MAKIARNVRKPKYNGVVIYRGPSMIDGAPIVAIATGLAGRSRNEKTGELVQTWIMRADIEPHEAIKSGSDASVCGDCVHRGTVENGKNVNRACYVIVHQAPLQVFRSYDQGNGIYPTVTVDQLAKVFAGRKVRLGSYGDPAAVPFHIWQAVLAKTAGHTGYTHQWNVKGSDGKRKFREFSSIVMASADSHQDMVLAHALGYRTFRVTGDDSRTDRTKNEFICPSSDERNNVMDCASCVACGGNSSRNKASVVITVHGASNKIAAFRSTRKAA